jgi:hypothetical protein
MGRAELQIRRQTARAISEDGIEGVVEPRSVG